MPNSSSVKWFSTALSIVLALVILVIIGTIIYIARDTNAGEKFSEFYLLGTDGKAENYPKDIILGQSSPVILGIVNRERQPATYRFDAVVDNTTIYAKGDLRLQIDEKWEGEIPVKPQAIGENQKVEFYLYMNNAAAPYRKLHLFVNVK